MTDQGDAGQAEVRWAPPEPLRRGFGGGALAFSLAGLSASFFVGWAFPLAIVGIVFGVLAVRRPEESRRSGAWAIALGALAVVYSAGWLIWAAYRLGWWG